MRRVAIIVLLLVQGSCIVQHLMSRRLTGTCDGACAHYAECKPGHHDADRDRCRAECPGVLADQDSLMSYESMSCRNAVEYIDGTAPPFGGADGRGQAPAIGGTAPRSSAIEP